VERRGRFIVGWRSSERKVNKDEHNHQHHKPQIVAFWWNCPYYMSFRIKVKLNPEACKQFDSYMPYINMEELLSVDQNDLLRRFESAAIEYVERIKMRCRCATKTRDIFSNSRVNCFQPFKKSWESNVGTDHETYPCTISATSGFLPYVALTLLASNPSWLLKMAEELKLYNTHEYIWSPTSFSALTWKPLRLSSL